MATVTSTSAGIPAGAFCGRHIKAVQAPYSIELITTERWAEPWPHMPDCVIDGCDRPAVKRRYFMPNN